MTNWPTKKLGEICELVGGGTPSTSAPEYWGGDIIWITPKDLGKLDSYEISNSFKKITEAGLKNSSAKVLPKGTVVLSSRAPIGYVAIAGIPLATNQGCRSYICDEAKIYNHYLFHFLLTQTDHLNSLGGGSTFKEISGLKLKELQIPLPPIEEQRKIVKKLEELFTKIDEAQKLREETQKESAALLPAALHQIFSQGKEKGWEEKELGGICDINPSKNGIGDMPDSTLVSFVPMTAVGEYAQSITKKMTRSLGDVRKGYTFFRDGDVLLAKITPCMENGKVALADNLLNGFGFGTTEFHVIRVGSSVIPKWVYQIIRQPLFREEAKKRMTGSAGQKRVPREFLEKFKILLPPLAEQKKIVKHLDSLSEKVSALQKLQTETANDFTALKQSILHKAFSGELLKTEISQVVTAK